MPLSTPASPFSAVEYPSSDGRPIAESTTHLEATFYAYTVLNTRFQSAGRAFVACALLIYYVEGDSSQRVAPDVFVAFGVPAHDRDAYLLWREPKAPDFVLEVTSLDTRDEDQRHKREVYASMGVEEFWLFDPWGEWLDPPLQGFKLHEGEYRAMPSVATVDGRLRLRSPVLGLDVLLEAEELRFHDPAPVTGEILLGHEEEAAAREAAQARLEEETAARQTAEARLEEEAAARQAAEARLAEEVAAREAAQARLAELEARSRRSG